MDNNNIYIDACRHAHTFSASIAAAVRPLRGNLKTLWFYFIIDCQ